MEKKFDTDLIIQKSFDFKKYEHLNEGVEPISYHLAYDCSDEEMASMQLSPFYKNSSEVLNLDWEEDQEKDLDRKKILHSGSKTYMISPLDSTLKFSTGFFHCVGIVITGVDKDTGKNISFLVHSLPISQFRNNQKENFIRDLNLRLSETEKCCKPGTIDAVIFGGNYSKKISNYLPKEKVSYKEDYLTSVRLIAKLVKENLKFQPRIIEGPHTIDEGPDSAYYDTLDKKLNLVRGKTSKNIDDFPVSDILS